MSEFPPDWQQVRVGNLLTEHSDRSSSNNQYEVLSVTKDGIFSQREYFKKQIASEDNTGYKVVKRGDVVFSAMNLWMGSIDVVKEYDFGIVSPAYITMRPRAELIDTDFLSYFLRGEAMRKKYVQHSQQGASIVRRNLNKDDLLDDEVAIPPLPEQKKIAEILSGIDDQIMRTRRQIAHFKKLGNATTRNLLGSLQDEIMPLSEVAINHDSRRVPIKSEERATRKGPYRYYGASGVIDTIDDFLFDGDYILIGEDGANIIERSKPLAFRVSGRFWVNNHAHIIQPREFCDINFLTHYLESLDYTGIASGSAQPKITRAALDSILIPVPTLETQKKIGSAVESIISAASNAEQKENKLLDLKQAMARDLLSGRKRVSV